MGAVVGSSEMITWGVDLDKFTGHTGKPWRRKHGIDDSRLVVLSSREWIPNSNIDLIVRSFAIATKNRPEMLLVLKYWKERTAAATVDRITGLIASTASRIQLW